MQKVNYFKIKLRHLLDDLSKISFKKAFISLSILGPIFLPFTINASSNDDLKNSKPNSIIDIEYEISNEDQYLIGPGDELMMNILSLDEFTDQIYVVLPDGKVVLPFIGTVLINNLTINEANSKIADLYRSQLLSPEVYLSIAVPRTIQLSVLGEVKRPGVYSMSRTRENLSLNQTWIQGFPTLLNAIQKAGGITQNSNLKEVVVIRRMPGGKDFKKTKLNILDLIFEGDQSQNIYMFDGDVVKVQKADKLDSNIITLAEANLSPDQIQVTIIGEVPRPGVIQIRSNTPLLQGLVQAGGLLNQSANKRNIELARVNRNGTVTLKRYKFDLSKNVSSSKNPILQDGDLIRVNQTKFASVKSNIRSITEPIGDFISAITLYKLLD